MGEHTQAVYSSSCPATQQQSAFTPSRTKRKGTGATTGGVRQRVPDPCPSLCVLKMSLSFPPHRSRRGNLSRCELTDPCSPAWRRALLRGRLSCSAALLEERLPDSQKFPELTQAPGDLRLPPTLFFVEGPNLLLKHKFSVLSFLIC